MDALNIVLKKAATYVFTPLQESDLATAFNADQQKIIMDALARVETSSFSSYLMFDQNTQLLLLTFFQKMLALNQSRSIDHRQKTGALGELLAGDEQTGSAMFLSLSQPQYQALLQLDMVWPNSFSFTQARNITMPVRSGFLATVFKSDDPATTVYDSLKALVAPGDDKTTTLAKLMDQLKTGFLVNDALYQTCKIMSPAQQKSCIDVQNILNKSLSITQLSPDQLKTMMTFLQSYMNNLGSAAFATNVSDDVEEFLETVGEVIFHTKMHVSTQNSFLLAIKQYLNFFNVYTKTIESPAKNGQVGFTAFMNHAKKISKIITNTQLDMEPPLFFYDDQTLKNIRIVPQLAKIVDGTQTLAFPTFAIELALNGKTINPTDGIEYTNQMSIGSFSYNKFFFIDTTQILNSGKPNESKASKELIGDEAKNINWLKKISVPVSSTAITTASGMIKNYPYFYIPKNPPAGSGFFMNIPVFSPDPNDNGKALINLFEQQLYAQPEWLNHSGFSVPPTTSLKNTPFVFKPGVMTMMRGCLGDFKSLIDFEIFDPCLTLIFKTALAMSTTPSKVDLTKTPEFKLAVQKCQAYLDEQAAQDARMYSTTALSNSSIANSAMSGNGAGATVAVGAVV